MDSSESGKPETSSEEFHSVSLELKPSEQPSTAGAAPPAPPAPGPAKGGMPTPTGKPYERWVILVVGCLGGLLASIQSSALVIAFPKLVAELGASIDTIMWVLLSFLLVVAAVVPITGKLGDMFGQQFLFNVGFMFFTIASLLSGFAQESLHGTDLIGYRCIQGIGATFLFSNSVAIITNTFIPYGQVGLAQGVFQMAFAAGSVLGPVVGGAFAERDYRWIFWFNVPPAFLCTVVGFLLIRNPPRKHKHTVWELIKMFDYVGAFLLMAFLTLLILALTQAVAPTGSLSTPAGIACLAVFSAVSLVLFCLNETFAARNPVINLVIFKNRVFPFSTIASTLASFGRSNVTYGMIFFLQGPYGEDPLTAGIQLIPLGIGVIITGLVSGFLADKVSVRILCVVGPIVSALGTIGLCVVQPTTNYWLIAFSLFVIGLGNGIFNSPNGVAGMLSVTTEFRGVASGIRLCCTFVSSMFGIVITFALILNSISATELLSLFIYGGGGLSPEVIDAFMNAIHIIFWINFACFVLTAMITFTYPADYRPTANAQAALQKAAQAAEGLAADAVELPEVAPAKESDSSKV